MGDVEQPTESEKLQTIVDKAKTLGLINNVHHISPPKQQEQNPQDTITIVRALDSNPRIQEIYLEAQGLAYDPKKKEIVQITNPYMNSTGAKKLVGILLKISQVEWSNIHEDQVPIYLDHFFKESFPYFTLWNEDYELDPRNFDYVAITIQMFLISSFGKAKGGKLLNVLKGTYDESFLGKTLGTEKEKKKQEGLLDRLNPFGKAS